MSIRSLVCTVFGVLAVWVLVLLAPKHVLAPKGILLPTQNKALPAISSNQVTIYHQPPLMNYQVLAHVRAEKGFGASPGEKPKQALLTYVKQLAGSIGANGVIVRYLVAGEGVTKAYTFLGEAIHVPGASNNNHGAAQ